MGTDYHFYHQRILNDPTICGTGKLVFYAISTLIQAEANGYLKLNRTKIGEKIDLRRETVNRHIKKLEAAGYLEVLRAPTNSRIPNIYRLPALATKSVTYFQAPADNPAPEQPQPAPTQSEVIDDHIMSDPFADVVSEPAPAPSSGRDLYYVMEDQLLCDPDAPFYADPPPSEPAQSAAPVTDCVTDDHTKTFVSLNTSTPDSEVVKESDSGEYRSLNRQTTLCEAWFTQWYEPCYLSQHPYDDFEQSELPELPGLPRDMMLQYLVKYGFSKVASLIRYAHEQENLRNPIGFAISVLRGKNQLYGWDELAKEALSRWGERYYVGKYASYFEN